MTKEIKTIIFDYGGVICTTRRSELFANWINQEYGIVKEDVLSQFDVGVWDDYNVGKSSAEECYKVFQDLGIPLSIEELKNKFVSFGNPDPKMKELIQNLKSEGYDLAILSDSIPEFTEVVKYNFPNTFRVEVFSDEVKLRKPDPAIYDLTLERIGNLASECLFIDDKEKNLVYPREIGINVHLFRGIDGLVEDFKRYKC
jgi:HAD superfamily hydrolase (TIGR01509 family)